jgi:SAM-dependent methyltransferase
MSARDTYRDPFVVSPVTRSVLHQEADGSLTDEAGNRFPVINGIPRFVRGENYASSFGKQWNIFQRTQLDKFNGQTISRDRFFESSRWKASEMANDVILEVGSGAGRFSQVLLDTGATLYSVDYSSAVDANKANNDGERFHLFQASVYELPFREASFDKVVCLGVLQHTPDPKASFSCLVRYLKPGGSIVVDIYRLSWWTFLWPKYWYRPVTKRMNKDRLMRLIRKVVPMWWPISSFLLKIPKVGWLISQVIPIANYSTRFPLLSKEELMEWAVMDTFDMLSPEYDKPISISTVRKWFEDAGFEIVYVGPGENGVVGVGRKR